MSNASNIKGHLMVRVIQAKNFEKCDPYFVLVADDLSAKSSCKAKCTEGVWNYDLVVTLDGSQDNFELQLWDHDSWSKDDLVDTCGKQSLREALAKWNNKGPIWVNFTKGAKVELSMSLKN